MLYLREMIYPAQTSLIPVQIALARFLEAHGWQAIFGNYPYWYLGTTPFRFLSGPIIPFLLVGIHEVFPNLSLFSVFYLLFTISWLIGGIGVYWLVKTLNNTEENTKRHGIALLAAGFYLFGPIVPFLFRFSDGLYPIAFSFLPFTLLMFLRLLKKWTRRVAVFLTIAISFIILLDSLIIPTLILGMAAILLVATGWGKIEQKLRQTLLVSSICFLISTLWYTPGYWLVLLGAPSLAGKGLASVVVWLGKLLPTVLAFAIAIFSVKFFKKRNLLRDFCFYWLFIFGFLTLVRFLSDPDFWLDWSVYGMEIQMGIAIAGAWILRYWDIKKLGLVIGSIYIFLFLFFFNKYVLGTVQRDITKTVEYRIGVQLSQIVKPGETVFLSGTTAFWLNAFFDIPQVRGGRDQVAVHPTWRAAVWEIREGQDPQEALKWLQKLEVDYLVVHSSESLEYYHDFVNPEKFEGLPGFKKVYEEKGDRIYQILPL